MPTETRIQGSPRREQLVGSPIAMLAPGYRGTVKQFEAGLAGGRAAGDPLPLAAAATNADAFVVSQLNVNLDGPVPAAEDKARSGATAPPRLIVPKRTDMDYAVLQTAPNGESRWLLPASTTAEEAVFELAPTPPATSASGKRGPVTLAIRGLVRVVAWAAAPAIGQAALAVARKWEKSRRPYGLHQLTPDGSYVAVDWPAAAAGPLLLLVHGTFSTPRAAFDGWVGSEAFRAVAERYGARCIALAHPSLSASPDDNIEWALPQIPGGRLGPIDVVCHSRGGLVARAIAASDRFDARRICQVGAPNHGTPLAQGKHMLAFLDGHTAFLTTLPDTVSTILLEGILSAVKLVAVGAAAGLPGLAAMTPDGAYLKDLGDRKLGRAQWFTIGADFRAGESSAAGLAPRVADKVADRFFEAANDLVVPSEGCHLPGPAPVESLELSGGEIHHTNYFRSPEVHARLSQWLL